MSFLTDLFQIRASDTRSLKNPDHRPPIRGNFPCVMHVGGTGDSAFHVDWFRDVVVRELATLGETPDSVDHIAIAYPHKAPSIWKNKPHEMFAHAQRFTAAMQTSLPAVNWIAADGICETRHLNRSGARGQDVVSTLTKKHTFDFIGSEQRADLPFMRRDHQGPSYFILLDDVYAQGTTAANMINFIRHNGGHVLAAASMFKPHDIGSFHLRQFGQAANPTFKNDAYNKGAIPKIADALAGYIWVTSGLHKDAIEARMEDYVRELDDALHHVGLSLAALTMGECGRLIEYFQAKPISHEKFIAALTKTAAPNRLQFPAREP